MKNPTIKIHNIQTDEIIEREMNAEELAQFESDLAKNLAQQKAEADKAAEKTALLERLNITEYEAKLLLS